MDMTPLTPSKAKVLMVSALLTPVSKTVLWPQIMPRSAGDKETAGPPPIAMHAMLFWLFTLPADWLIPITPETVLKALPLIMLDLVEPSAVTMLPELD